MGIERREVVIIGAGPAGSAAAREAALAGLRPLLVEKDSTPGATNACGGFAAEVYRRKLALPDEVAERQIRHTRLWIDGRLREYGGRRAHYISFRRAPFDSFLAQRAVDAGAELMTSTRASVLDAEREVEAGVVLFADGPSTLAADALGIGHVPGPRTRHAIFVELEGDWGDGSTCELVLNTRYTKSYFWLFPKRGCVWAGVGGSLTGGGPPLRPRLEEFIEGREDLRGRRILRQGGGLVPSDVARDFVADGAMVLGDAAGLVNPMTGGGIAFALASGEIAGRVAAKAIRAGCLSAGRLREYPRRFKRTPHYWWLNLMAYFRRRLEAMPPSEQPEAYARALQRYLAFFHHMHRLVDFALGFPRR